MQASTFENWIRLTDEEVARVKLLVREVVKPFIELPASSFRIAVSYCRPSVGVKLTVRTFNRENGDEENEERGEEEGKGKEYQVDLNADGTLNAIFSMAKVDTRPIEQASILRKFPIPSLGIHQGAEGEPCIDNKPVEMRGLYSEMNASHHPLCKYQDQDFASGDRYALTPAFDFPGHKALLITRNAWGLNVCPAFFEVASKTLWCWASQNFDYPTGISIRLAPGDEKEDQAEQKHFEIYLDRDEMESTLVYKAPDCKPLPCMDNVRYRTGWVSFHAQREFQELKTYVEYVKSPACPPFFTSMWDTIRKLLERFDARYNDRLYTDAIAEGQKVLELPLIETCAESMERISEACRIRYGIACCEALAGNADEAMKILLQIEVDWHNWTHFRNDKDFESLKDRDDFKALLARHSPSPSPSSSSSSAPA